jgi:hypothetical protein
MLILTLILTFDIDIDNDIDSDVDMDIDLDIYIVIYINTVPYCTWYFLVCFLLRCPGPDPGSDPILNPTSLPTHSIQSTVQHSTAQYSTVQYSSKVTILYCTIRPALSAINIQICSSGPRDTFKDTHSNTLDDVSSLHSTRNQQPKTPVTSQPALIALLRSSLSESQIV